MTSRCHGRAGFIEKDHHNFYIINYSINHHPFPNWWAVIDTEWLDEGPVVNGLALIVHRPSASGERGPRTEIRLAVENPLAEVYR
jgi:hypothetical protein